MRKAAPRLIKNKVPSALLSRCTTQHKFTFSLQVVFDKYAIDGLMNSTTLGRILKKDKVAAPSIDSMLLYLRRWRGVLLQVVEVFKLHDANHDQFLSWLEMVRLDIT